MFSSSTTTFFFRSYKPNFFPGTTNLTLLRISIHNTSIFMCMKIHCASILHKKLMPPLVLCAGVKSGIKPSISFKRKGVFHIKPSIREASTTLICILLNSGSSVQGFSLNVDLSPKITSAISSLS